MLFKITFYIHIDRLFIYIILYLSWIAAQLSGIEYYWLRAQIAPSMARVNFILKFIRDSANSIQSHLVEQRFRVLWKKNVNIRAKISSSELIAGSSIFSSFF